MPGDPLIGLDEATQTELGPRMSAASAMWKVQAAFKGYIHPRAMPGGRAGPSPKPDTSALIKRFNTESAAKTEFGAAKQRLHDLALKYKFIELDSSTASDAPHETKAKTAYAPLGAAVLINAACRPDDSAPVNSNIWLVAVDFWPKHDPNYLRSVKMQHQAESSEMKNLKDDMDVLSGLLGKLRGGTSLEEGTFEKDVLSHLKAQKKGYVVTPMELSIAFGMSEAKVKARMGKLVKQGKVGLNRGRGTQYLFLAEDSNMCATMSDMDTVLGPMKVDAQIDETQQTTLLTSGKPLAGKTDKAKGRLAERDMKTLMHRAPGLVRSKPNGPWGLNGYAPDKAAIRKYLGQWDAWAKRHGLKFHVMKKILGPLLVYGRGKAYPTLRISFREREDGTTFLSVMGIEGGSSESVAFSRHSAVAKRPPAATTMRESLDVATNLVEDLAGLEEGLVKSKDLSKSRIKGLVNRAWDWAFYRDLDDRYYFDGTAINMDQDWKDLSARQVQQIAQVFGVKKPHRSKRQAVRQALTAIRDMKRAGKKKAPAIMEDLTPFK